MRCEIRGRTPSRVRSALGSCIVAMCPSDRCSLDHARGDSEDRTEAAKLRAGSSSSHRSERTDPAHLVIRGEPPLRRCRLLMRRDPGFSPRSAPPVGYVSDVIGGPRWVFLICEFGMLVRAVLAWESVVSWLLVVE